MAELRESRPAQEAHIQRARASLQRLLSRYARLRRQSDAPPELQATADEELRSLQSASDKLEGRVVRLAAFGLVGRGKSALINALLGRAVFETGPLHGVTRWPRSVRWTPPSGKVQLELVDTPGLDEIEGQQRAQMALEVARDSDLILFVTAEDLTRTEYQALNELRQAQKPLLLVLNKADLYPDADHSTLYRQLQQLGSGREGQRLQRVLTEREIVTAAADPAPVPVRVERSDGTTTYEWETPPPQIGELQQTILQVLNREGRSLLALNALFRAQGAEARIAETSVRSRQREAEARIWTYAKYKALAVALNPIAGVDVVGATAADLALIRTLARLYELPMTRHEAGQLWRRILGSSGGVLVGELGGSVLLGMGKSGAWAVPGGVAAYGSAAIAQAGIAAYGTYAVGRAAQRYLAQGGSWGPLGPSTVIREILDRVDADAIVYRLRQELGRQLG